MSVSMTLIEKPCSDVSCEASKFVVKSNLTPSVIYTETKLYNFATNKIYGQIFEGTKPSSAPNICLLKF